MFRQRHNIHFSVYFIAFEMTDFSLCFIFNECRYSIEI